MVAGKRAQKNVFFAHFLAPRLVWNMDAVLALHCRTLRLDRISCNQLVHRGVEIARHLGYSTAGIEKGSCAAQGMSIEARAYGGQIHGLAAGGVTASLQSIGAAGNIKPQAKENLAAHMRRLGLISEREYLISVGNGRPLVVVDIPPYFSSPAPDLPMLMNDYKQGGYNQRKAETMLAESMEWDGRINSRCRCCLGEDAKLVVEKILRLENKRVFERFKAYEAVTAQTIEPHEISQRPCVHEWLQRLADKNGLCRSANTVYLLHGTKRTNLSTILEDGLKTSFSLNADHLASGKGLYFTTKSCKAFQYGKNGYIIISRVVLGRIQTLERSCPDRFFPDAGFDSATSKKGYTRTPNGQPQVHDEYIVYNEAAVYPEFVLEVASSTT